MIIKKKSQAVEYLEKISGGPLSLGSLIKSLRLAEEMTQEEMAKRLGISKVHLSQIEKEHKFLSPERAQSFAKKLGYPPVIFVRASLQDLLRRANLSYQITLEAS